jgi:hypothetical protein
MDEAIDTRKAALVAKLESPSTIWATDGPARQIADVSQ